MYISRSVRYGSPWTNQMKANASMDIVLQELVRITGSNFRNKIQNLKLTIFFFFNDTAPTEIYTLPLPGALPISVYPVSCRGRGPGWRPSPGPGCRPPARSGAGRRRWRSRPAARAPAARGRARVPGARSPAGGGRSEKDTSELQYPPQLGIRLSLL